MRLEFRSGTTFAQQLGPRLQRVAQATTAPGGSLTTEFASSTKVRGVPRIGARDSKTESNKQSQQSQHRRSHRAAVLVHFRLSSGSTLGPCARKL